MTLRYSALLVFVAACSSSGSTPMSPPPPPPAGPATSNVTIADYNFSPLDISIKAGEAIRWTNTGAASHSATSDDGTFNSGTLGGTMPDGYGGTSNGGTYSFTFPTAGMFKYHCAFHPTMKGTITVTP